MKRTKYRRGFSLIEIISLFAIFALIAGITAVVLSDFNKKQSLEQKKSAIISYLSEARTLTVSARNNSQYGIHFENNSVTRFRGNSYDENNSENRVEKIGPYSSIVDISLSGGGNDVVFDKLYGTTSNSGTITLSLKDGTATSTVSIFESGIIE